MSNMPTTSRPPSVHAPWRKSLIILLFTLQLGTSLFQLAFNVAIYGSHIYTGTDSGMKDLTARTSMAVGVFGLLDAGIVITHIIYFARFRLTTGGFLIGNSVLVGLSGLSIILNAISAVNEFEHINAAFISAIVVGGLCFFSICTLAYSVLIRLKVKAGKAAEMARPGSKLAMGREVLGAQEGIPMV